jgi:hypothetical protein
MIFFGCLFIISAILLIAIRMHTHKNIIKLAKTINDISDNITLNSNIVKDKLSKLGIITDDLVSTLIDLTINDKIFWYSSTVEYRTYYNDIEISIIKAYNTLYIDDMKFSDINILTYVIKNKNTTRECGILENIINN